MLDGEKKGQIRVALTGSHGTGKSYIVDNVRSLLEAEGLKVGVVESPTRSIKALGFNNNQNGDWELQLLCLSERFKRQRELLLGDYDVILADRALSCETSYTKSLLDNTFDEEKPDTLYLRTRLHMVHDLTLDMFIQDVEGYWDKIFLKTVHEDHLPVDDGDRSGSVEFQAKIEKLIKNLVLHRVPDHGVAHPDRDEAVGQIYNWIKTELKKNDN